MATVITSIGAKSTTADPVDGPLTINTQNGSGTPWTGTVTFNSAPTANVGDMLYFENVYYTPSMGGGCSGGGTADVIYLITGISGDGLTLTVKYISGASSTTAPMDIKSDSFCSTVAQPYVLRFYSTPNAWNTALENASDLYDSGDSAQGELYKDSYYSVNGSIYITKGFTQGLVRVGLTVPSSQRHDGTAGSGVEFKLASSTACGDFALAFEASGAVRRLLEWVEYNGQTYGQAGCGRAVFLYGGGGYVWFAEVNHCLVHNFQWGSTNASAYNNVFDATLSAYYCAQNNIIYDHTTESDQDGSLGVIGINCGAADGLAANNTVHDIRTHNTARNGYGILCADSSAKKVVNNICTSCSDDDFSGAAQGNNNLSSDSTAPGSNSVTGASASDLFENPTRGSEDLHLKNGAEALRAGADLGTGYTIGGNIFGGTTTAITTLNIDIDGRNRDSEGDDWDIGADQCDTCYAYNFAPAFLLFLDN